MLAALCLGIGLLSGCGQSTSKPAPQPATQGAQQATQPAQPKAAKLSLGLPTVYSGNWTVWIAESEGFLKQENLEVEITVFDGMDKAIQALESESLHFALTTPDALVRAAEKKVADTVLVGTNVKAPVYSMIVGKGIQSYGDLKGKAVGVYSTASSDAWMAREMLKAKGLGPKDYEVVAIGGSRERYAALKAGSVQAALLGQPQDFQLMDDGFKGLGLTTEVVTDFIWEGYTAKRSWAKANEDVVVRYLRAMSKAHAWLYNPANKERAIELFKTKLKTDDQLARRTYELWVEKAKVFSPDAGLNLDGMKSVIDSLVAQKTLETATAPEKYVELSYHKKAVGR